MLGINIMLHRFKLKQKIAKHKHNKMAIMLFGCTVFFGLIFGYKIFGKIMMNHYFNNMPVPAATISTAEVKHYTWDLTYSAVGSVQAINSVNVTTEAPGVVETIKFNSGDKVAEGDILIELNTKVDAAKLAALQAAKRLADLDYTRAQQLLNANNIAKAERDTKQSVADQASANVAMQQELINQKQIHAPFAGQLGIRQVNIGEYVAPGRAIVSLESLDPIYVDFSVPEQELYRIKPGLEVNVQVAALKDEIFTGKITAIEPGADPATRNFNVQATFDNKEYKLRQGMFADVVVKLASNEQVMAIPRSAISYNPYGDSVYLVSLTDVKKIKDVKGKEKEQKVKEEQLTGTVKRRFIKLGRNNGEMVEVVAGLTAQDIVATSGLLKLRNDARVIINNAVQPNGITEQSEGRQ